MIDLHSHVLPGIDDGPPTIEGSLAIARAAAAGGTSVLVATPHVNWRYRSDPATIARLTAELNARLAREATTQALQIRAGAEIAVTMLEELGRSELAALGLGGGRWLLVEPPFAPVAPNLEGAIADLVRDGHRVVLAHPERCPALHREPQVLERLVKEGVVTSVTAGSLSGCFGEQARRFALAMAREGILHNVASDTHDAVRRPPSIIAELEQADLGGLAPWLTQEVPAAILDGEVLPERPPASVRRAPRPWRRLRPA